MTVVSKDSKVDKDPVDQLVQQDRQDQLDLVDQRESKASRACKEREDLQVNKEIVVSQDLLDLMDLSVHLVNLENEVSLVLLETREQLDHRAKED